MCEITTGLIRTFHNEEKTELKDEVNYINDKKEGIEKSYWRDGKLYSKVNYINDKKEGIGKTYHYNG